MYRGRSMTLSFPPFTRWVKRLIIICAAVYFLEVVLGAVVSGQVRDAANHYLGLVPAWVLFRGFVWQLVTYSFLHANLSHLLINMLTLWMFGSQEEQDWGSPKFLEFYFFCVIGAALVTVGVSYTGLPGLSPLSPTIGASGGIYGLLIAFGMLYGDREVLLFPFPFSVK